MRFDKTGSSEFFPEETRSMPEAEIPIPGSGAWVAQGPNYQVIYWDINLPGDEPFELEPHTHALQFGVCLDGEMELTIDGETRTIRPGDHYIVPADVVHSVIFLSGSVRAVDFYAEENRWPIKKK